jgi:serine/threonine protein kinase/tetratricopeptide (TPR) repeat protein
MISTNNQHARAATPDDPRVIRAVEEYVTALEAGTPPDRRAFLAHHADIADALAGCLDGLDFIRAARPQLDDATAAPEEAVPAALGDFSILREVGRGGMGIVYEAEQLSLGRRVALKVLPFAATMDPRQLQRFRNEARAAASLEHPHIVPVYGVGCERAVHFYAMKFIEGQSLAAIISARRRDSADPPFSLPLTESPPSAPVGTTALMARTSTQTAPRDAAPFRQTAEWGIQAAEALEHAHSVGIVHRDIKPANLMIDGHGALWVTDFGLARTVGDAGLTMTGDVLGTLRYMSPEQALAKHGLVDHRTDIYSLGVTLFELLAGRSAVQGKDREQLLNAIARDEPLPLRAIDPAVPADLETIVGKATAKEPAERYGTARELAEDLRRFLTHEPIRAKPPGLVQRARKWAQRHRPAVVAAALVMGVTTAALAVVAYVLWLKAATTRDALVQVEKQRTVALANEAKANRRAAQAEQHLDSDFNVLRDLLQEFRSKEFSAIAGMDRVREKLVAAALRHYESYLDAESADPEVRHWTVRAYGALAIMQKDPRKEMEYRVKALALSEALTRDFPDVARYWQRLAHSRFELAALLRGPALNNEARVKYRQAIEAYETAARLAPDNARTLNNLAWHLAKSDDPAVRNPTRAVVLARRALELDSDDLIIWDTLGVACYYAGAWDEAVTALEKGLRRALATSDRAGATVSSAADTSSTITSRLYLALAYSRLGNIQKARSAYDNAAQWLDHNPTEGETRDEQLRLRAEAAGLLGLKEQPVVQEKVVLPQKN